MFRVTCILYTPKTALTSLKRCINCHGGDSSAPTCLARAVSPIGFSPIVTSTMMSYASTASTELLTHTNGYPNTMSHHVLNDIVTNHRGLHVTAITVVISATLPARSQSCYANSKPKLTPTRLLETLSSTTTSSATTTLSATTRISGSPIAV